MTHIELFAGCGGMSLGLHAAGFKLFMANEQSPMASETFSYNLLGENLKEIANQKHFPKKTLWIRSNFKKTDIEYRLRESPFDFINGTYSDLDLNSKLEGKLIIGSIDDFLKFLKKNKPVAEKLKNRNIDLISGGPPCQGFSLAGKREKDDYKNLLPLSFAKLAGILKPKMILLENVKGITAPFSVEGIKYYAWLEVAKAFSLFGYVPICFLLNSKFFGIPQNRPRFILLGFRKDIFDTYISYKKLSSNTISILNNSHSFYKKVISKKNALNKITPLDIQLYNIEKDKILFNGELLPKIKNNVRFITSKDAIDDIKIANIKYNLNSLNSEYSTKLKQLFNPLFANDIIELHNHEVRKHSLDVKSRFRLYQVLNRLNGCASKASSVILGKTSDELIIREVFEKLSNENLLLIDGQKKIDDYNLFLKFIENFKSKKQTQRALKETEPAPAQLTIPDDLCHYSPSELRTLTVREMARLQSFPDWFIFRSKVTTGGKQRSYEVPQYTQIGNAVPPLLAYELGNTIKRIIKIINNA